MKGRNYSLCIIKLLTLLVLMGTTGSFDSRADMDIDDNSISCLPFLQVNQDAFGYGLGLDQSYFGEEGFEVAVYKDQLYLGMEADNSLGARLWRSKKGILLPASQNDWEEVIADENGFPFGIGDLIQNDHIDSLAEFNGYIYASTANRGVSTRGTRIFRSPSGDPKSWQDALINQGAGFGDLDNVNFKDMQVFQGVICGGTHNLNDGAQVWCSQDGTNWEQKNQNGFGESSNVNIWSGFVFKNALYFGVQNTAGTLTTALDDFGRLYRTADLNTPITWQEVFRGANGSYRVDILGELNGYLYIAIQSNQGVIIWRSSSGDANSWEQVSSPGVNGNPNNSTIVVDGATVYADSLFVAVGNLLEGFSLWRTQGQLQSSGFVDWEQVGANGLGQKENVFAELVVYNDRLFVWTTNYLYGQKVMRSSCNCQNSTVCDNSAMEYGDLPSKYYLTIYQQNGARHQARDNNVWLGESIDFESDGKESENCRGDDLNATDDEDGLIKIETDEHSSVTITLKVNGMPGSTGCLTTWLDYFDINKKTFTSDGKFNEEFVWNDGKYSERVIDNMYLPVGIHQLSFGLPTSVMVQNFFWRFRIVPYDQRWGEVSNGRCQQPTISEMGQYFGGEVEDYSAPLSATSIKLQWVRAYPERRNFPSLILIACVGIFLILVGLSNRLNS